MNFLQRLVRAMLKGAVVAAVEEGQVKVAKDFEESPLGPEETELAKRIAERRFQKLLDRLFN